RPNPPPPRQVGWGRARAGARGGGAPPPPHRRSLAVVAEFGPPPLAAVSWNGSGRDVWIWPSGEHNTGRSLVFPRNSGPDHGLCSCIQNWPATTSMLSSWRPRLG